MSDKPPFDPSKPFEVYKPPFDSSKPFEVASGLEAPKEKGIVESILTSAPGKIVTGFAKGAGEAFNPFDIPHDVETIGRTLLHTNVPLSPEDASKGLFGRIGAHFSNASKQSLIPSVSLDDGAAAARAAVGLAGHILQGKLPDNTDVQDFYDAEKSRQQEFNQRFINPTAEKVGELAGTGANMWQGGKDIVKVGMIAADMAKAGKIGEAMKAFAQEKAVYALKPKGAFADSLFNSGRDKIVGEQMLKDGILNKDGMLPPSFETMQGRIEDKLDEYGKQIGYFAEAADKARSGDSSIRGIPREELVSRVQKEVIEPLMSNPETIDDAKAIQKWLDNTVIATKGETEISFGQAQEWKKSIGDRAKFHKAQMNPTEGAYRDLYDVLNTQIEDGIGAAIKQAAPQIENKFIEAKDNYRNLKDAEKLIDSTVNRTRKNRDLSPGDMGTGLIGAVIAPAETMAKVAGAVVLGGTNRAARLRGSQFKAGLFDNLSKVFNKNPQGFYDLANTFDAGGGLAQEILRYGKTLNTIVPPDQTIEFTQPSIVTPRR